MASTEGTSAKDDVLRCKFVLPKKQRQCRQMAKAGLNYCGQHLSEAEAAVPGQEPTSIQREKRVQCPYGKHTVAASNFKRHIKICNDRKETERWTNEPFYVPSINAGPGPGVNFPDAPPELADFKGRVDTPACKRLAYALSLGSTALSDLISRLDSAYKHIESHSPDTLSILGEKHVEKLAANAAITKLPFNKKHGAQHASLIANMDTFGLFKQPEDTIFIEFGAGKGYLTNALVELIPEANSVVMMDNQKFKLLADRFLREKKMSRVRCDIADFEPCGLPGFDTMPYWIAYGKHLCGAATDLTLRCAYRYLKRKNDATHPKGDGEDDSPGEEEKKVFPNFLGLGVATCCHHRCSWQHYIAQDIILELGFTAEEFEIFSYMASWALCGHGASNSSTHKKKKSPGGADTTSDSNTNISITIDKEQETVNEEEEENLQEEEQEAEENLEGATWRLHHMFSREERQLIGKQCKRLIDYGRVEWMCRNGLDAQEVLYCDAESSGENRLVLAKPKYVNLTLS